MMTLKYSEVTCQLLTTLTSKHLVPGCTQSTDTTKIQKILYLKFKPSKHSNEQSLGLFCVVKNDPYTTLSSIEDYNSSDLSDCCFDQHS